MSDPLISEMKIFGPGWAPRDWGLCMGAVIAIVDNTALYSLIGTIYGGDGRSTLALPDIRGRAPIGFGQAPALSNRSLGHNYGYEAVLLSVDHMPAHNHDAVVDVTKWGATLSATATAVNPTGTASGTATVHANGDAASGTQTDPSGRYWSNNSDFNKVYADTKNGHVMATDAVDVSVSIDSLTIPISVSGSVALSALTGAVVTQNTGSSLPFEIMQPSIAMNWIIAMDGTYPSRN